MDTVVFVGAATLDFIALVEQFPAPDERCAADEIVEAGGGPAATAAVAAARLGCPAAFVGAAGDDPAGDRVIDGLANAGVDVAGVVRVPGARTASSVVVVDAGRGTRAICNRPGPDLRPPAGSAAARLLTTAERVHTDHIGWPTVRNSITGRRRQPAVSVDEGNPIPALDLALVDTYMPTLTVLRHRYQCRDWAELSARAIADGARLVVATDGPHGSQARAATGPSVTAAAVPIRARSTLGAGDVFHGSFIAAQARGLSLDDSLAYANAAAALSCAALDGRSAIPDHDAVTAFMHRADTTRASTSGSPSGRG